MEPVRRLRFTLLALAIVAVAFLARLAPVIQGGGLRGIDNYDAGVYFGSAIALTHGRLPYRDFLLLHPPGITVLLTPFAALTPLVGDANAMAVARLAVMLLGGVNALLVARVLQPLSLFPAVFAAFFYAVFYPAVTIEHSTRLEGFAAACLLGALILLGRWTPASALTGTRYLAAGGLLGLATTIKIWGVVPLVAVAGLVLITSGLRQMSRVLAGAALVGTAVCLPFFASAPGSMWQQVVLDQLERPESAVPASTRMLSVLGLGLAEARLSALSVALLAVAVPVGVVVVVLALTVRQARLPVLILVVFVAVLLATPSWFPHYAGVTAAPLAVAVGAAAHVVLGMLRERSWQRRLLAGVLVAGLVPLAAQLRFAEFGDRFPRARLVAYVAAVPGCVTADDPSAQISLDVVSRNLQRECPLVLDLGGYSYHFRQPGQGPIPRRTNEVWQTFALDYLRSGTVTLNTRFSTRFGFSKATEAEVNSWPVVLRVGKHELRQPQ